MVGIGRMMFGSTGMNVNRMLDALGLPDTMGDIIGASVDGLRGDPVGMMRNVMDASSGMRTGGMDMMFGAGLPPAGFVQRPFMNYGRHSSLYGAGYSRPQVSQQRLGFGARGRSMELNLISNPSFRANMERRLGGTIVPDGRMDGRVTVLRYTPSFGGMNMTNQLMAANPMMGGVFRGLSLMENNMRRTMGGMLMPGFNMIGANPDMVLLDPQNAQLARGMGMKPPLSFEDLLFLMMMKYAKKKERDIMQKMNELSGKGRAGGYAGRFGSFMGGISSLGGTLLGGMYGGFPMGTMMGGQLGSAVGGMFGGRRGAFGNRQSDTTKQMQMQKLMEDLKKMYEMLSNVMKAMNSMQMAAVRNLPR